MMIRNERKSLKDTVVKRQNEISGDHFSVDTKLNMKIEGIKL